MFWIHSVARPFKPFFLFAIIAQYAQDEWADLTEYVYWAILTYVCLKYPCVHNPTEDTVVLLFVYLVGKPSPISPFIIQNNLGNYSYLFPVCTPINTLYSGI